MDIKHAGARCELIATIWLLKQGFDVFRNVSQHGIVDIIAMKGGEIIRMDVKAARYNKDGSQERRGLSAEQVSAGVKCLLVFPDDQCVLDFDPPIASSTTISICMECSSPIVHFSARPQKFCTGTQCKSQFHRRRRSDADQA